MVMQEGSSPEDGCCFGHGHTHNGAQDNDHCIATLPSGEPCPCEQYVLPKRVKGEVQRILDWVAQRMMNEHLAHVERKIVRDDDCPVCKRAAQETDA